MVTAAGDKSILEMPCVKRIGAAVGLHHILRQTAHPERLHARDSRKLRVVAWHSRHPGPVCIYRAFAESKKIAGCYTL